MTFPLPRTTRLRAGCAVGAVLVAGPAAAEISPQEVRDRFVAYYERTNIAVEAGSEEEADGTLTLSDVSMSFSFTVEGADPDGPRPAPPEPDREVRVEAVFPEIAFAERPGGEVLATVSPEARMTVTSTQEETGATRGAAFVLRAEGFELTVAEEGRAGEDGQDGTAGADGTDGGFERRYGLSADRLAIELQEVTVEGEPVEADALLSVASVTGETTVSTGAGPDGRGVSYAQSGGTGAVTTRLDLPAGEEDGGGRLVSLGEIDGLTLSSEGVFDDRETYERARMLTPDDDPSVVFEGATGEGTITAGAGRSEYAFTDPEDPSASFSLVNSGASSELAFTTGEDGVGVDYVARDVSTVIEGGVVPVPRVEIATEEAAATFRFPLLEGPGPFELRYDLSGLTLNDELWALFDPDGALPRDPASLLVALQGQLRVLTDFFDEERLEEMEESGEMPLAFDEVTLEFGLDAVGASVEADGDFTIDNENLTTFPGTPAPTGTLTVNASGIDGLLDTLTDMGLVPPDQLMPARMMLGLFARPDGSGGYTSRIEVDGETGSVTANGQRLR